MLGLHVREDSPRAEPHASHVHVLHLVPLFHGPLVEWPPLAHGAEVGGVVDQNVDSAGPSISHASRGVLHLRKFSDIDTMDMASRDTSYFVGNLAAP